MSPETWLVIKISNQEISKKLKVKLLVKLLVEISNQA